MRSVWRPEILAIVAGVAVILGLYIAGAVAQAAPLTVEVDAIKKFEGFPAGFKLHDPETGQPETVVINADVVLAEEEFAPITSVALGVSQLAGDAGFQNFGDGAASPSVELPLPIAPDYAPIEAFELTHQLPRSGTSRVALRGRRACPDNTRCLWIRIWI